MMVFSQSQYLRPCKLAIFNIIFVVLLSSCGKKADPIPNVTEQNSVAVAEITNANNFSVTHEPLYFSFYDLGLTLNDSRIPYLSIVSNGKPLPSQLVDKDGDGVLDGIFFVADFSPAQIQTFSIVDDKIQKQNNLAVKNNADPNDKNYSELKREVFKSNDLFDLVGIGYWTGKAIESIPAMDNHKISVLNKGDLLSALKINYEGWSINHQQFNLEAQIDVNTGSYLTHVTLKSDRSLPGLALSLGKSASTTLIEGDTNITGSAWTYIAAWQKLDASSENKNSAVAIIFHRGDRKQQLEKEHAYISVMNSNGGDLEYYIVTAKSGEREDFVNYLNNEVQRLTKTPRIRFESSLSKSAKRGLNADDALIWAKRLADSELERKTLNYHLGGWDEYRKRPVKFEYDVVGMQIQALQDIDAISPNEKYKNALEKIPGSYIKDDGTIATYEPELFSIDLIKPGQMVILLEQKTKQEKYRKAVDYLRARLKLHPRTTQGGFWHRSTYPNQLWLDGVYMGMPFLVQYAAAYETGEIQHHSFTEAVREFEIAREHLRNPETGLYYHAWDESKTAEWADKQTGRAPQYWSRGMGWYAMALVDVLDFIPESEPALRKRLIDIINEFAPDILRYQDVATATWWQITDRPGDIGNYRESSASAMFSYFLLKSVNKGYLPASYGDAALKTYRGLLNEFITLHADGKISMNDQCLVAGLGFGRDGSYNYYLTESIVSNDPKGNSPFIYASLEAYKYLKKK